MPDPDSSLDPAPSSLTLDLFRHGIAAEPTDGIPDLERPLTKEGIRRTQAVAKSLKKLGIHWDMLLTSPLLRATQTAQIALSTRLTDHIEVFPPLAPGGSFQDLVLWQQQHPDITSLAVVGHQPDLSSWILAALVNDWAPVSRPPNALIPLKKAGLARIQFPSRRMEQGSLVLLLSPKILLGL
ncbi:MAG: phosphohistidine phosphatase SixA [Cyanophyceae cyanobacterium]